MARNGYSGLGVLFSLGGFCVAMALIAFTVWAFVDILRRPRRQWAAAGHQQAVWALVVGVGALLGVGAVAALLYVLAPLPRLRAAGRGQPAT